MSDENSEQPQSQPPSTDSRLAWLPENFKTPEELVTSYTDLRKRFSRGEHKQPEGDPNESQALRDESTDQPSDTLLDSERDSQGEPRRILHAHHMAGVLRPLEGLGYRLLSARRRIAVGAGAASSGVEGWRHHAPSSLSSLSDATRQARWTNVHYPG